ncbi:hypothetical protein GUJ93_ZPchr0003g17139 [Zizania palustris]|uniref:Uncharacterized protein n=1 Tax=Zizania palustris TaxID=103762 RepID=A0A8J5SS74_ZIZPA|nr:hypothetical protein GUJ93_ZPchr0003g17139 [Zizania palustris]
MTPFDPSCLAAARLPILALPPTTRLPASRPPLQFSASPASLASAPLTPPRLTLPPTTHLSPASAVCRLARLPASTPLTPPDLALPPTTCLPASRPPPRSAA